MARSAYAVVPRDTLLESGRVTRPPLRAWVARELGEDLWRLGVRAARHLVGVPLELAFLESLMELEVAERDTLAAEREALLQEPLYATLLRSRGLSTDAVDRAAPVLDELRARLERIADSPLSALPGSAKADRDREVVTPAAAL